MNWGRQLGNTDKGMAAGDHGQGDTSWGTKVEQTVYHSEGCKVGLGMM